MYFYRWRDFEFSKSSLIICRQLISVIYSKEYLKKIDTLVFIRSWDTISEFPLSQSLVTVKMLLKFSPIRRTVVILSFCNKHNRTQYSVILLNNIFLACEFLQLHNMTIKRGLLSNISHGEKGKRDGLSSRLLQLSRSSSKIST